MSSGEVDSEEKTCEEEEEGDEESPAMEGHFLMDGSVMEVVLGDNNCSCCCHQEQIEGFELTRPFSCSKCSQQFCCKCLFLTHRELHRGERRYSCQVCGKSYLYKSDLARHRPVHLEVKPHVCKVCGRSFNQVGHLITHRLIHTGEKPFECDICHKPFNRKSNLQKHKMIHTGERPFLCLVCGARFGRKGDLQRHTMLHTGERPYKCEVCDKSFSQKPHLLSHQSVHTGERPYKCSECDRSFNRKSNLLKHQVSKCPAKHRELHLSDFFSLGNLIVSKTVKHFDETELESTETLPKNTDLLVDASNNNLPEGSGNELSVLRARLSGPSVSLLGKVSDVDASSADKQFTRSHLEHALLQSGHHSHVPSTPIKIILKETRAIQAGDSSPDVNNESLPRTSYDKSVTEQSGETCENNT